MVSRPSSSGISRSIRTRSGARSWTLRIASMPFRAVAMTRNSPVLLTMSLTTRRKNGLSSTTSTVDGRSEEAGAWGDRLDVHPPVCHAKAHGAPVARPHVLRYQREVWTHQRVARRHHVPLAHVHRTGRGQRREHARPAGDARGNPS